MSHVIKHVIDLRVIKANQVYTTFCTKYSSFKQG